MYRLITTGLLAAALTTGLFAQDDNSEKLADASFGYTSEHWGHGAIGTIVQFKMSEGCWAHTLDEENKVGAHQMSFALRDLQEFFKDNGWFIDTWSNQESNQEGTFNQKRAHMKNVMTEASKKLVVSLDGTKIPCNNKLQKRMLWAYFGHVTEWLGDLYFKAPAEGLRFNVIVDPTVKDVKVTASPDKKTFTIVGPSEVEPTGWGDRISGPLMKYSK
jgi:hypothetical protein